MLMVIENPYLIWVITIHRQAWKGLARFGWIKVDGIHWFSGPDWNTPRQWVLGKDRNYKKLCMTSGKRRMHSVSGRHDYDRWRNASGIFRKVSEAIKISDIYRSLPTSHGNCQSLLYPCYVKRVNFQIKHFPKLSAPFPSICTNSSSSEQTSAVFFLLIIPQRRSNI